MLPLRDDNPTTKVSVVVPILVAINVVVFLFVQPTIRKPNASSPEEQRVKEIAFFFCHAAVPYEVTRFASAEGMASAPDTPTPPGVPTPAELRAIERDEVLCPGEKSVWLSMLFSMFMHGGWLHIAGNMLFLWVFGNNIEDLLGRVGFIAFYLVTGFLATFAHAFLGGADSTIPLIGASGAIAGVLGAYLITYPRARVTTLVIFFFITMMELPAVLVLGAWFVLQVFNQVGSTTAVSEGVAYLAHIGGFVAGLVLVLPFRGRRRLPPGHYMYER